MNLLDEVLRYNKMEVLKINDQSTCHCLYDLDIRAALKHHCAMICALISDAQFPWYIYLVIP